MIIATYPFLEVALLRKQALETYPFLGAVLLRQPHIKL
jgi:hypothetical protein